jgi:hypothetical protein
MRTITLRVEPDTLESIDEEADERDQTRSEYIRELFRTRHDHERIRAERDRLRDERDDERTKREDLRRQL